MTTRDVWDIHKNDFHNPKGVARGLMNIIWVYIWYITRAGLCSIWLVSWELCNLWSMEKENEPPIKKRRLSLKSPSHSRFLYKSKEELETISKGFVPPNTAKKHSLGTELFPRLDVWKKWSIGWEMPREYFRRTVCSRFKYMDWIAQLRMKIWVLKKKMGFHCFMAVQLDRYQFSNLTVISSLSFNLAWFFSLMIYLHNHSTCVYKVYTF